ncbi:calcium-binding protein [Sinorhizobium terangae]|uniref:calcium-binding protein n=1 Tax=Sinorhizobium terangae TaxID=110322 RepID=UPI0024B18E99|nr:calcium-binding protein [Sinorhizobium terangae]WFU51539.1 calcium-binding protein [Sinorhizobium terangae]
MAVSISMLGDIDQLDGGEGNDTVTFQDLSTSVFVDLVLNQGEVRTSDTFSASTSSDRLIATLIGVENVIGTKFDDRLFGNDAANTLSGNAGDDVLDGRSGNDTLSGGLGDDTLLGYLGNDILEGGHGADRLEGGAGNDTYVFTRGDGNDGILEVDGQGTDSLRLKGIVPSEVSLARAGNDLLITVGGGEGGTLRLVAATASYRHFDQYGIEEIVFDDGTKWDTAFLRQWSIYDSATDGDDTLIGTDASGKFGGGKGNDTLDGGRGNDTYYYSRGDGNDTITEGTNSGNADQLILVDINAADVTLVRNGNHVTLAIAESAAGVGDAGSILIKEALNDFYDQGIDKIVFTDGAVWTRNELRLMLLDQVMTAGDDTIAGFNVADFINAGAGNDTVNAGDGNDIITGGLGNDTIDGGRGIDTYYYSRGDGNDTITEGTNSGNADQLILVDINAADVTLVRNGNHVTLAIAESAAGVGDAGSILIKEALNDFYDQGIDKIVFTDGAVRTRNELRLMLLDQVMTAGDDTIAGFNVADLINAGAGNDTVNAGDGNDIITGGLGNDTIDGGRGIDTYYYSRGDGNDTITEGTNSGNADQLILVDINPADVTLVRNGNHVTLAIAESAAGVGDAGSILIKEALDDFYDQGVDKIVFAGGTTWTRADMRGLLLSQASTSGNDTIVGFNAADTIAGGLGDDTLTGGAGNDAFVFRPGFGLDTITDFKAGSGAGDVLEFQNTLFANFESVLAAAAQAGSDTVITFDAANTITLKNVTLANLHADDVRFVA